MKIDHCRTSTQAGTDSQTKKDKLYINYVTRCYIYDLSKLLLLIALFTYLDLLGRFLYCYLFLFRLRITAGGIHFKKYMDCLLFSMAFFLCIIIGLTNIKPDLSICIGILFLCIIIICILGPIHSSSKPSLDSKHRMRFKKDGTMAAAYCSALTLVLYHTEYGVAGFWTIILYTLQLIAAYLQRKGGEKHVQETVQT